MVAGLATGAVAIGGTGIACAAMTNNSDTTNVNVTVGDKKEGEQAVAGASEQKQKEWDDQFFKDFGAKFKPVHDNLKGTQEELKVKLKCREFFRYVSQHLKSYPDLQPFFINVMSADGKFTAQFKQVKNPQKSKDNFGCKFE